MTIIVSPLSAIITLLIYTAVGFAVLILTDMITDGAKNWNKSIKALFDEKENGEENTLLTWIMISVWPIQIVSLIVLGIYRLICKINR